VTLPSIDVTLRAAAVVSRAWGRVKASVTVRLPVRTASAIAAPPPRAAAGAPTGSRQRRCRRRGRGRRRARRRTARADRSTPRRKPRAPRATDSSARIPAIRRLLSARVLLAAFSRSGCAQVRARAARDRAHLLRRRRRLRRHRKRDGVRTPVERRGTDPRRRGATVELALRARRDHVHTSRGVRGGDDLTGPGVAIHLAVDRGRTRPATVDHRPLSGPRARHDARAPRPQPRRSGSRAAGRRGRSVAWRRSASTSDYARRSSTTHERCPGASGHRGRGRRSSCPAGPDRRRRHAPHRYDEPDVHERTAAERHAPQQPLARTATRPAGRIESADSTLFADRQDAPFMIEDERRGAPSSPRTAPRPRWGSLIR